MYVRIVNFRLDGLGADEYERHCEQIAEAFAAWPGLVAKIWLADRDAAIFGGVYLFDSEASADASRSTPAFAGMSTNPHFVDLDIREFHTLAAPSAVTGGPLTAAVA